LGRAVCERQWCALAPLPSKTRKTSAGDGWRVYTHSPAACAHPPASRNVDPAADPPGVTSAQSARPVGFTRSRARIAATRRARSSGFASLRASATSVARAIQAPPGAGLPGTGRYARERWRYWQRTARNLPGVRPTEKTLHSKPLRLGTP
jgi:hypothetical protein